MQGRWVRSQVREDSTCHAAPTPVQRSCWAHAPEPACCNDWALILHPQSHTSRAHAPQEKPLQWEACISQLESSPPSLKGEKAHVQHQRASTTKNKGTTTTKKNPAFSVCCGFPKLDSRSFGSTSWRREIRKNKNLLFQSIFIFMIVEKVYMKVSFKENFTSISTVACQEGRTYFKSRRYYYSKVASNYSVFWGKTVSHFR